MNTSKNLTIASLVLGGVGALLFLIHKTRGVKKSSLMANGSKLLIAIGIILLAIAVLLLSENRDSFSYKDCPITISKEDGLKFVSKGWFQKNPNFGMVVDPRSPNKSLNCLNQVPWELCQPNSPDGNYEICVVSDWNKCTCKQGDCSPDMIGASPPKVCGGIDKDGKARFCPHMLEVNSLLLSV
jgi:hypothetical protein